MAKRFYLFLLLVAGALLFAASPASAQWMKSVETIPWQGQKDVPLDQVIVIRFKQRPSKAIVNSDLLYELPSKTPVSTQISYSDDGRTVFITPRAPLRRNTYYSVNIASLLSEYEGRDIYDKNIEFTTVGGVFRCIAYSVPPEATIPPGGFRDVVYNFIESGGGLGEVKRCTLVYETEQGQEISRSSEEMKLILKDKQTVKFPSTVSVPKAIGEQVRGKVIYIRRLFEGVDGDGNFFTIRTGIKTLVMEPSSGTGMTGLVRASIQSPETGAVVPKGAIVPAKCAISGTPGQQVHGCWIVNGVPCGFFADSLDNNGILRKSFSDKSLAAKEGVNSVALQIISPEKITSEPCEYIVSATPVQIPVLLSPKPSQVFRKGLAQPPTFIWSDVTGAMSYKFTISTKRPDSSSQWISLDVNRHTPDRGRWGGLGSGVFYWAVIPVFPGGKDGTPSAVGTFMISDAE